MYKRKRLFDRGDSYRETGIPCGNPKRVHTGEVLCMPSGTAGASAAAQMAESMQTQGEEQLRVMAQKQLNTKMTLQELSSQHRQFTEAGKYKPVLKEMKGVLKLQDYEGIARGDERVEALRQCGLTDDEIRLQLSREGTVPEQHVSFGTNKGTYGTNPVVQEDQLQDIDKKMKEKEASLAAPDTFRGRKQISRQEMDIEKSMFWGTNHENGALMNLLTENMSAVTGDPNDPINHLPQLMADIEEKARETFKEKRRRRRRNRKLANKTNWPQDDGSEEESGGFIGCLTFEETQALKQSEKNAEELNTRTVNSGDPEASGLTLDTKDMREGNNPCGGSRSDVNPTHLISQVWVPVEKNDAPSVTKTNALSLTATQSDRKVLKGPVEFLPEEYIKEKRLSLEQIKNLPKFANYKAGNPSNVLYVKNLSPRVSEQDLVSMFGRFQNKTESPIVYRLMTGRMRGQAFVTFDSVETASEAMQLINGFLHHGKPVIVQYGRRTAM